MGHLKLKTILVYSAVIVSVLALFQGINFIGITQLKAPSKMTGIYDLDLEDDSDCSPQKIQLNLEQSGVYFFGNINLNSSTDSEEKTTKNFIKINGKLKLPEDLLLSGTIKENSTCFNEQNKLVVAIKPVIQENEINGYLMVNEKQFNFKGKLQPETESTESKH